MRFIIRDVPNGFGFVLVDTTTGAEVWEDGDNGGHEPEDMLLVRDLGQFVYLLNTVAGELATERERCACIADAYAVENPPEGAAARRIAAAIRAANTREQKIVFIINGEDVIVKVTSGMPLRAARNIALESTGNTGRPADEWDIYNPAGTRLDSEMRATEAPYRLILSLKAGANG